MLYYMGYGMLEKCTRETGGGKSNLMADNVQKITASLNDGSILCSDNQGAQVKIGGGGPRATDLLLMAVAGCSAATLSALLKRDGYQISKLDMTVEGLRGEERPRRFTDIYVKYDIRCEGLAPAKLEEYLKLTEQFCPVIQSVSARVHLNYVLNG